MNIEENKLFINISAEVDNKLKELTDKVVKDYKYMYTYNMEVVLNNTDTNRRISTLNKKVVDLEIDLSDTENTRNIWCGLFFSSLVINILAIGALCLL